MSAITMTGNEIVCSVLEQLGVQHAFGLPGTQNVPLFEALRRSRVRTVVPTHELAASFMAGAYARVAGRVGVLVTIPGPGFMYALTGLAEARLDSAPVVHLVGAPARGPGRTFNLQAVDQAGIATPLAKAVLDVDRTDQIAAAVTDAFSLAVDGEPGPVVVQLSAGALNGTAPRSSEPAVADAGPAPAPDSVQRVARRLRDARRVVLYVGQGARDASEEVRALAERISAPVATTPSGRGVLPEDHALALGFDGIRAGPDALNALMAQADAVLVLGAKLGHNGTAGFAVQFPRDRTVQVDADRGILGATYDMADTVHALVRPFLSSLMAEDLGPPASRGWADDALDACRAQLRGDRPRRTDPRVEGAGTAGALFAALRSSLPRDAIVVTDTGRHQQLVRRYFDVLEPGGLLIPSDLQSMGFGLPAAIAAKLAAPHRPVVAVMGDGGFLMSGLELATAVREAVPLTVIVVTDGVYAQIRDYQLIEFGHAHGVTIGSVGVEGIASALGCEYRELGSLGAHDWGRSEGVVVAEVRIGDSMGLRSRQAKALIRESARRMLGRTLLRRIKRWMGR
jgi:acetolactate synthase I/II/III large subunit